MYFSLPRDNRKLEVKHDKLGAEALAWPPFGISNLFFKEWSNPPRKEHKLCNVSSAEKARHARGESILESAVDSVFFEIMSVS